MGNTFIRSMRSGVVAVVGIAIGIVSVAGAAEAGTTTTVCVTHPYAVTEVTFTSALPQFDPALGTFQSATVTATAALQTSVDVTNGALSAADVEGTSSSRLTTSGPDGVESALQADVALDIPHTSIPGGATVTFGPLTRTATASTVSTDAGRWVGTGSVTYSTTSLSNLSLTGGAGHFSQNQQTSASFETCVAFEYTAAPEVVTPQPTVVTPAPELVAPAPELVTPAPQVVVPALVVMTSTPVCVTHPSAATDVNFTSALPQFNPALGTFQRATVTATAGLTASVDFTNQASLAVKVSGKSTGTLTTTGPDGVEPGLKVKVAVALPKTRVGPGASATLGPLTDTKQVSKNSTDAARWVGTGSVTYTTTSLIGVELSGTGGQYSAGPHNSASFETCVVFKYRTTNGAGI